MAKGWQRRGGASDFEGFPGGTARAFLRTMTLAILTTGMTATPLPAHHLPKSQADEGECETDDEADDEGFHD